MLAGGRNDDELEIMNVGDVPVEFLLFDLE